MNEKAILFADIGFSQCNKHGQKVCGDVFKFRRIAEENRVIAALSDGLGSGIKANILANMTATMALKFMSANMEMTRSAEIMMEALPLCRELEIGYATFSLIDIMLDGTVKMVEMGNPEFLAFRAGENFIPAYASNAQVKCGDQTLRICEFAVKQDDRLILMSDGISQTGSGTDNTPAGWGVNGCRQFLAGIVSANPAITALELADQMIREALRREPAYRAGDDMTCAVIHFRQPRRLMLVTGPPFDPAKDAVIARDVAEFPGKKVICGGTTAGIIARELARELSIPASGAKDGLPPCSTLPGMDLVTEGIYTLTRTAQYLEGNFDEIRNNAAGQLAKLLICNDIIEFHVGTRINQAHQDPNLPIELEIRRSIIKRIAATLQKKYYKNVIIKYF